MSETILLVDDDADLLKLLEHELGREGLATVSATTGAEALALAAEEHPAVVVLDLLLPDVAGKDLLERLRREHPGVPVVMLTARTAVDDVVECMRLGAVDYVQKPFDRTRVVTSIRNAMARKHLTARVESLTRELRAGEGLATILGESPAIRRVVELLERAAGGDVTVMLEGESGTGKEVAARAVHAESARRSGPFVAVNCGAIPEGLVESELFGHEKGAFTGATAGRMGRFEEANGGTIFLDEVAELRPDLQVRLLRVLQDHSVQHVGGGRPRKVDARVIAATNRDLKAEVARAQFRSDLYYRLAVFPIRLPPLRERGDDVELLAGRFLAQLAARQRRPVSGFTPEALRALRGYGWPGNVRELMNAVERAVLIEDGPVVTLASLPDEVVCPRDGAATPRPRNPAVNGDAAANGIVPFDEEERRIFSHALELTHWNLQAAADRLGVGRATIYRKIEKYTLKEARGSRSK